MQSDKQRSTLIRHGPCPECGSRDNLAEYSDGHTYCYGCSKYTKHAASLLEKVQDLESPTLEYIPLLERNISLATAEKYHVQYDPQGDEYHYCYNTSSGISHKIRKRSTKSFRWSGGGNQVELFGQSLFPAGSAQAITVTEGEFDAMAAYELSGSKYPVVSLVNGASGAVKDIQNNWEYLNSFDRIYLNMDADQPGQEAANKVASLFPIGKIRILSLRKHKDANDYLRAGQEKEYLKEWWSAPIYTPAGLKLGSSMWDEIVAPRDFETVSYPWKSLNDYTYGIRLSELVVINADTGVGKTLFVKEIVHHILTNTTAGVGLCFLEEPNSDTCLGIMSVEASRPLHLPDVRSEIPKEELRRIYDAIINSERVLIWDHFGSNSIHEVLSKIRHMAALGCKYIVLDHLSIVVSDQSGDERKQLDEISTKIKTLCMELNICCIVVVHQNRQGQIRGSAGVEQLANIVIKLSRDKEEENVWRRNITQVMVQKNRFSGDTGPCTYLEYDKSSGRLIELNDSQVKDYKDGQVRPTEERWNVSSSH